MIELLRQAIPASHSTASDQDQTQFPRVDVLILGFGTHAGEFVALIAALNDGSLEMVRLRELRLGQDALGVLLARGRRI